MSADTCKGRCSLRRRWSGDALHLELAVLRADIARHGAALAHALNRIEALVDRVGAVERSMPNRKPPVQP